MFIDFFLLYFVFDLNAKRNTLSIFIRIISLGKYLYDYWIGVCWNKEWKGEMGWRQKLQISKSLLWCFLSRHA